MNRTITLVVDEAGQMQLITGGFEWDEAGMAFAAQTLRITTLEVERELIREQVKKESEEPEKPEETPGQENDGNPQ